MSERAMKWAAEQGLQSADALRVLLTLARLHEDGGMCLPTVDVGRKADMDHFRSVSALWFLRNKNLISADGIGGLMSVTLGCDFDENQSALVSALPQDEEVSL
ncbi:hypothetical protein [Labrenzia sp. DG1229]|uniref:hypothetical protein n=1 Tax=Labrenzia sp. DG1229 TaxID=681847 RepID=UPI00048E2F42|nr:hypothetical protein [Labrenzia sp. DG1229]